MTMMIDFQGSFLQVHSLADRDVAMKRRLLVKKIRVRQICCLLHGDTRSVLVLKNLAAVQKSYCHGYLRLLASAIKQTHRQVITIIYFFVHSFYVTIIVRKR